MELTDKDYILSCYMASDFDENDWYMMIWKKDDTWHGQYTFRYNRSDEGDDAFSGKDEKNVYNFTCNGNLSDAEILDIMDKFFNVIKIKFNRFVDMFIVKGDISKFMEIAKTKDYLHMKELKNWEK